MSRIRSVHPDILTSLTMASLGTPATRATLERTFVRLWTVCDDQGRVRDHLALLKASMYPAHEEVTPEKLDAELWELAAADLIVRYTTPTRMDLIQVLSWHEYQHPQRPTKPKLPELSTECVLRARGSLPDLSTLCRVQLADGSRMARVQLADGSRLEGRGEEGI